VLIPALLREKAAMSGEVVVAGRIDYLEVWNHERFAARLEAEPLSDDDLRALAERGF
jgi:DNA-binding transcriptional regulator/RsmH inhibitor MraZ